MLPRLQFSLILLALVFILKWAALGNPAIRARLKARDMAVRIQAGSRGRTFVITRGKIPLFPPAVSPEATLTWSHPTPALKAMTSGYDGDMMVAFQRGDAEIQGRAKAIFQFFSTLKEIKDLKQG
ncbi:MAG: hypothetical protein MI747_19705 [Desulfobacterales bacterium]|nr:hypothetical protein [Desulfobacterales bacterium]